MLTAFSGTFADPAFFADAEKQQLDVSKPMSGEDLAALIAAAYKTPDRVVERLQKLSRGQ